MANCHFDQIERPVPVGVITTLGGIIIISNFVESSVIDDYYKPSSKWMLSGARVMITRFWASSTASIVVVPHIPSGNYNLPEFPEDQLGIEREFCLWLGYIEKVRAVTQKDLTDGNLVRVFVGVFDNDKATGSEKGGYTVQLQARDRMKYLMDSEVYYSTTEITSIFNTPRGISRSDLIHDIARRAFGNAPSAISGISPANYYNAKVVNKGSLSQDIETGAINPYAFYNTNLKGRTRTTDDVSSNPDINIITTRVKIGGEQDKDQNGLNFILNGQVPLDIIKSVAFQEVYPTEFFQDSRDGNYYYGPRANDSSGLDDSDRFNRTYFFNAPEGANGLDINQNLIAYREEFSSIGLKTNFFVSVNSPLNSLTPHNDYVLHLATKPFSLKNVDFVPKFHRINDPTIKTPEEAAVVALSAARIWAKETNVAMAVNIGDPSIVPGEVVQIFGSPLLPDGGITRGTADRQKYQTYESNTRSMIQGYATFSSKAAKNANKDGTGGALGGTGGQGYINKVSDNSIQGKFYDGTTVNLNIGNNFQASGGFFGRLFQGDKKEDTKTVEKLLSSQRSDHAGFEELPRTIWRVEAVHHKFNLGSPGFTSELALVSPF